LATLCRTENFLSPGEGIFFRPMLQVSFCFFPPFTEFVREVAGMTLSTALLGTLSPVERVADSLIGGFCVWMAFERSD